MSYLKQESIKSRSLPKDKKVKRVFQTELTKAYTPNSFYKQIIQNKKHQQLASLKKLLQDDNQPNLKHLITCKPAVRYLTRNDTLTKSKQSEIISSQLTLPNLEDFPLQNRKIIRSNSNAILKQQLVTFNPIGLRLEY